eukprot:11877367-Prorocentrum_lima.AAC.1
MTWAAHSLQRLRSQCALVLASGLCSGGGSQLGPGVGQRAGTRAPHMRTSSRPAGVSLRQASFRRC